MTKFLLFLLFLPFGVYSQCPTPTCSFAAVSGTNYTVTSGQTLCIKSSTNYTSGSITLNGGTLYVESGSTLSTGISANSSSVINSCGVLNTTFNNNLTINNYANNATISYAIDNGVNFNNYAVGVTLNVNSGNPNNSVNITNSVGSSITVVTNTNNNNCSSSLGNSTNIINNGDMTFPNALCMKNGLITNNKNLTFNGQLAMDGGTIESKIGSNTSINTLRKNNGSINVYSGSILSISNIINFDGNSIKMMDPGCSYVTLSTPPSSSFNSNLIDNGSNVWPNGINYCGGVPRNSAASGNTISSVVNASGVYRITLTSGTNAPNNGDYVYITGVVGGNLNGYWRVTKISNYVYDLVNGAYSPITSLSSNFIYTNNLRFGNGTYMGESGCSNPCVPLPIVFTYFNIYQSGQVSYGIAIDYSECILQSSSDGVTFTDLNRTSKGKDINYNIVLGNDIYYRIKCVDVSGNIFYSSLKVVQSDGQVSVEIYPNPTLDGVVNITWSHLSSDDISSDIELSIFDLNGVMIQHFSLEDFKNNNILVNLPKGVFLVKIYGNNIFKTFKVLSL